MAQVVEHEADRVQNSPLLPLSSPKERKKEHTPIIPGLRKQRIKNSKPVWDT
jgi:hypothetical protein